MMGGRGAEFGMKSNGENRDRREYSPKRSF